VDVVKDGSLVFSRDQIITSSQASKNFGEIRRRARKAPLYVADRNNIDTVIVDYETFEEMAVELERLREQQFYASLSQRLREGDADSARKSILLADAMGDAAYAECLRLDPEAVSDEDLCD
jgi:PHD/YefM family antitoxin component YafN of YafNO toxin-antitoxin module